MAQSFNFSDRKTGIQSSFAHNLRARLAHTKLGLDHNLWISSTILGLPYSMASYILVWEHCVFTELTFLLLWLGGGVYYIYQLMTKSAWWEAFSNGGHIIHDHMHWKCTSCGFTQHEIGWQWWAHYEVMSMWDLKPPKLLFNEMKSME